MLGITSRDKVEKILKASTSLKTLSFGFGRSFEAEAIYSLESLIGADNPLEVLDLTNVSFSQNLSNGFFKSLGDNTKLKRLILKGSRGLENLGSVEDLMDALANSSLEEIVLAYTEWSDDGTKALVEEAMRQRSRQESYLQVLRKGLPKAEKMAPTTGRIFFCGHPQAGKTTLASTMIQVQKKRLWENFKRRTFGERTEGIEIQVLRDDDKMQIVLWDLAGQEIFRALQEHLFPKINKACLYLFVINPCDYDQSGKVCQRHESIEDAFEKELKFWLCFICTNSNITGRSLPHLVVVITHNDQLQKDKISTQWATPIIHKLRQQFARLVEISTINGKLGVDSQEKKDIRPILEHMYKHFDNLSVSRSNKVPDICYKVNKYVLDNQSQQSYVTVEEFFSLCKNAHQALDKLDGDEVLRAMTKYLHDAGTIIDLSNVNLIVVNPNWLTNVFLGRLISIGHNFQSSQTASESSNGYVSTTDLDRIMGKIFSKGQEEHDHKTLQQLLIGLDLCHEVVDDNGNLKFFVPTLFESCNQSIAREWSSEKKDSDSFLGLRMRCANPDVTYLTTAVFTRFQVFMHKILKEDDNKPICLNYLNCICLLVDGYEILIECDSLRGHVDVLVKIFRQHQSAEDDAWSFVWIHIVEEMRKFYASPKGTPGVALVCEIIRKECVERPTPCHLRGKDQAVSITELKKLLKQSIDKMDFSSEAPLLEVLYCHRWPQNEEAGLKADFDYALDLLRGCPDSDAQDALSWIREASQSIKEKDAKVQVVVQEMYREAGDDGFESTNLVALTEHEKTRHLIRQEIQELRVDIMNELYAIQKSLQQNLGRMMKKFEDFTEYSKSLTEADMPKHPYFTTKDVHLQQRVTAIVRIGVAIKLHFMCESRYAKHVVADQEGYELIVEKPNCEWLRSSVQASIKVFYYLAKAALQTTVGLGDVIAVLDPSTEGSVIKLVPVASAASADLLLNEVKLSEAMPMKDVDPAETKEAWRFMKDKLRRELEGRYGELFGLYKARYDGSDHAWLCRDCLLKGIKSRVIIESS